MERLIEFAKIEATGNDFILVDARKFSMDWFSESMIQSMCHRHFGIGADGIIFLSSHPSEKYKFNYYNSDGREAEMCANGSRAAVLMAYTLGIIRKNEPFRFEASDGLHQAEMKSPKDISVEVIVRDAAEQIEENIFNIPDDIKTAGFINTGVPHLVLSVKSDLDKIDVNTIGMYLRNHSRFGVHGTNVNFVKWINTHKLQVRTFERGVESETLSCGTGMTASAILFWPEQKKTDFKMQVETKGGSVNVLKEQDKIFLEGPANIVYVGSYLLKTW
ncbi:MAG: diaminopimelate epimerase [Calditrichaceae bacterium]